MVKTHFPVILRSWSLEGRVPGERSQAWLDARWVTAAMLLPHQLLCFKAVFKEFLLHWRGIGECEVRLFCFFSLFLLAICDICFLPWDLQLQSTPSLCTLKIYFYVGMLRYLVGVRWVVSGRGKREKAVGIFFFLTWNQFKAILFILGHITIIIIITNITLFFFYLRNWSSEVIINSSCKMFFTGGLRIHREFLLHFLI